MHTTRGQSRCSLSMGAAYPQPRELSRNPFGFNPSNTLRRTSSGRFQNTSNGRTFGQLNIVSRYVVLFLTGLLARQEVAWTMGLLARQEVAWTMTECIDVEPPWARVHRPY